MTDMYDEDQITSEERKILKLKNFQPVQTNESVTTKEVAVNKETHQKVEMQASQTQAPTELPKPTEALPQKETSSKFLSKWRLWTRKNK